MEGAILSPFLYTIFIDGLARQLEAKGLGCRIGGKADGAWGGALYYADDLCLLAKSGEEMQQMLRVLDEYCRDWQFQPAYSKTKVLRFGACKQETFHERVLRAHVAVHGRVPTPAEWGAPAAGKADAKQEREASGQRGWTEPPESYGGRPWPSTGGWCR